MNPEGWAALVTASAGALTLILRTLRIKRRSKHGTTALEWYEAAMERSAREVARLHKRTEEADRAVTSFQAMARDHERLADLYREQEARCQQTVESLRAEIVRLTA